MTKRLTYEFVRDKISESGYRLLSKKYESCDTKLEIECDNNHVYQQRWDDFQQGHRCPYCSGVGKPSIDFIREEVEKTGYKLLSGEPIRSAFSFQTKFGGS